MHLLIGLLGPGPHGCTGPGPLHVALAPPSSCSSSRLSLPPPAWLDLFFMDALLADYRSETDRVTQEFGCSTDPKCRQDIRLRCVWHRESPGFTNQDHAGRRRRHVADTRKRTTTAAAPDEVVAPARRAPGHRGAHRPGHPRALRRDVRGHARPRRGPGLQNCCSQSGQWFHGRAQCNLSGDRYRHLTCTTTYACFIDLTGPLLLSFSLLS